MSNSFNFLEIKFKELTDNVNSWIKDLYNKSDINLDSSSPYGHILQAVIKIYENSLIYLKNTLLLFDLNNPNNNNTKVINAMARIGGYDPARAISSSGTIALKLRSGVDISNIGNNEIVIINGTQLTNNTNGLYYFVDLGTEHASYKVEYNKFIYLPIVQGKKETQPFTGDATNNQSYSIKLSNNLTCEQYRVNVKVDGEYWTRTASLNDMLPDEKSFYCRTGLSSALDVYFGTGNFGAVPRLSSKIEIEYVISNGSFGNIPTKIIDDFDFKDDVYDGFGNIVDIRENFFIHITDEIGMGSNAETVKFTKAMMPFISRNFVLARPEQYIFTLRRLNMFSQIDAFTTEKNTEFDNDNTNDDSVVYLLLIPNISLYITSSNSYYDLDKNAFYLDDSEKSKIEQWLKVQGIMSIGTAVKILEPVIKKYITNYYIRIFEDANDSNVRNEILNKTSDFFTNLERRGRIDKSAIIKIVEEIDGVDSVNVEFMSEENEAYHGNYEKYKSDILKVNPLINPNTIVLKNYNKNLTIGLDDKLGDIIYAKNELPIIRGGWYTRDGNYFKETPQTTGLGSVNISILGYSKRKLF